MGYNVRTIKQIDGFITSRDTSHDYKHPLNIKCIPCTCICFLRTEILLKVALNNIKLNQLLEREANTNFFPII